MEHKITFPSYLASRISLLKMALSCAGYKVRKRHIVNHGGWFRGAARLSILTGLIWAMTFPAAAQPFGPVPPLAEIPYRIDYLGWITVDVKVNGEGPYAFIIDSGATITSVFANLAASQEFTPVERPPIKILGLAGAERLPPFFFGDLQIGSRSMNDHVGVILPDWSDQDSTPQGILGLDFLTRYNVEFDPDAQVIRLYDASVPISDLPRGWSKTRLRSNNFGQKSGVLYLVSAKIQGRRIPCIVDLGATGTLFNYPALRRLLSGFVYNGEARYGTTTGSRLNDIFENTATVRQVRIRRISIADAVWRKRILVVYNAQIFKELGVHRSPFCLLGSDLMAERSFIFDFAEGQLYLGPKAPRRRAQTG